MRISRLCPQVDLYFCESAAPVFFFISLTHDCCKNSEFFPLLCNECSTFDFLFHLRANVNNVFRQTSIEKETPTQVSFTQLSRRRFNFCRFQWQTFYFLHLPRKFLHLSIINANFDFFLSLMRKGQRIACLAGFGFSRKHVK